MELFYQKLGEGPALIILHGLYGLSDNWISLARKLSIYQTVYLIDLRNHGRSPHHPEHSYPAMAGDLYSLIEQENLHKVSILGHSMGGKTAMLFAALYPELMDKLIVVDIGPGGYAQIDKPSPQVLAHLNIVNAMLSLDFSKMESRTQIDKELALSIKDDSIRQFLLKNVHRNPDNSFRWKLNIDAISKAMPAIMGKVALEKYGIDINSCKFRTLFIKGELSDYISGEQEDLINKYFPCHQLVTIKKAGHWVHAEQPESFMESLECFLKSE